MAKKKIEVRHKSPHEKYRRAGFVFSKRWEVFELDAEQLATVEADEWLELRESAAAEPNLEPENSSQGSSGAASTDGSSDAEQGGSADAGQDGSGAAVADLDALPEGWTANKSSTWWTFIDAEGNEHKVNGGKTAAEAYAKLMAEQNENPAE